MYNGWTNYETWNCKLWIDNDEGESAYWNNRAQGVEDVYKLAEELQDYYDERAAEFTGQQSGFFVDLLNKALIEVDWYEIAEHLYEDNHEEEKNKS